METPKLKAFLPVFYLVWSDDLLTQKELLTLGEFINSQEWLNNHERSILLSNVDIHTPPSRQELAKWKLEIEKSMHANPEAQGIFDLSVWLSGNDESVAVLRPVFSKLENDLGILGDEIIMNFRGHANTITSAVHTVGNFDPNKLAKILDGSQAAVIQRVKSILGRPEFAYLESTDINIYREKVLEWCQLLAKEGLGGMGYPRQFGGGGDMAAYFAIMETLSYHDLSLVIKFGVQFGLWGNECSITWN